LMINPQENVERDERAKTHRSEASS
jgi:hypothetical protein